MPNQGQSMLKCLSHGMQMDFTALTVETVLVSMYSSCTTFLCLLKEGLASAKINPIERMNHKLQTFYDL